MMKSFLLNIQYKGSDYFGWQVQNNAKEQTIQGELEKTLKKVFKTDNFKTLGASRTDRGVHALDQYCKLDISLDIDPNSIRKALNDQLPRDIAIKSVVSCDPGFHPIFNCEKKTYKYLFTDSFENIPVLHRDLIYCMPYELDIISMNLAASKLIGVHDFSNFQCTGTDVASTEREIYRSDIKSLSDSSNQFGINLKNIWVYTVEGNGFLKQMVRLIMGGLFSVGRAKISVEQFEKILNKDIEERAGKVVGPEGLHLTEIIYKK